MKPMLIGIAGRSGAGKTEIARQLAAWLPGHPQVVSLDSYYYALDQVPLEDRGERNFDHPESLDWPLIIVHVQALARGESPIHYPAGDRLRRVDRQHGEQFT